MEVYTRPHSPYWYADLSAAGRRRRVSLKLLASGRGAVKRAVAARAADELQASFGGSEPVAGPTLRTVLDAYCQHLAARGAAYAQGARALSDKAVGGGQFAARWHLDPDRLVSSLTTSDMRRLVSERQAEGNSPQTIKHELALLRAAVRHSAGDGVALPALAMSGVRNAWAIPDTPRKTRFLSWDEWQRLYDHLSPARPIGFTRNGKLSRKYVPANGITQDQRQDAQDLLVALTMTGGRWSEVAALTWDRLDLDNGVGRLFGTKDGEERLVPLPSQFIEVLRRRHATATGHLVFPGKDGERSGPSRAIGRAMAACGLNSREDQVARYGRATIHSLRHTFASWLLQHGAGIAEVQDALGHASIAMTRRYAHLSKSKTAAKLSGILSGIGEAPQAAPSQRPL